MYKTAVWKDQKHLIIKLYCRDWDEYCFQRRKRGIKTKSWLRSKVKKTLHKNQIQTEQISQTFGCKNEICVSPPGEPKSCRWLQSYRRGSEKVPSAAAQGRCWQRRVSPLSAPFLNGKAVSQVRPPSVRQEHQAFFFPLRFPQCLQLNREMGVKTIGLTLSCHVPDNTTRNNEWFIAILKFTPLQFYRANIAARLL